MPFVRARSPMKQISCAAGTVHLTFRYERTRPAADCDTSVDSTLRERFKEHIGMNAIKFARFVQFPPELGRQIKRESTQVVLQLPRAARADDGGCDTWLGND